MKYTMENLPVKEWAGVITVAFTIEIIKYFFKLESKKVLPIISGLLGILYTVLVEAETPIEMQLVKGITIGLTASGGYDVLKAMGLYAKSKEQTLASKQEYNG